MCLVQETASLATLARRGSMPVGVDQVVFGQLCCVRRQPVVKSMTPHPVDRRITTPSPRDSETSQMACQALSKLVFSWCYEIFLSALLSSPLLFALFP